MAQVTAIKDQRRGRVKVFLDGSFAFSLEKRAAEEAGLEVGQSLTPSQIENLTKIDQTQRCANAALRYLGYRPRSEAELRLRLRHRGFEGVVVEGVISRLKEQGLVDDATFARFWRESRESFRPRSRWMVSLELRRKGVAPEVIEEAVRSLDDDACALEAASKRVRIWVDLEGEERRRRLSGYLRRRGFSYEVVRRTLEQIESSLTRAKKPAL